MALRWNDAAAVRRSLANVANKALNKELPIPYWRTAVESAKVIVQCLELEQAQKDREKK
ncbi:MAG: hypothetical protein Q4C58_11040 [Eubacteriales bacterium]|nr:hypothetical protein [Eubacteriales bacterium]